MLWREANEFWPFLELRGPRKRMNFDTFSLFSHRITVKSLLVGHKYLLITILFWGGPWADSLVSLFLKRKKKRNRKYMWVRGVKQDSSLFLELYVSGFHHPPLGCRIVQKDVATVGGIHMEMDRIRSRKILGTTIFLRTGCKNDWYSWKEVLTRYQWE